MIKTELQTYNNKHKETAMKRVTKKTGFRTLGLALIVAISGIFLLAVGPANPSAGTVSAATQSRMFLYNEKGSYGHVKITLSTNGPALDDSKSCGGHDLTSGQRSFTRPISKSKPLRLTCSPVGGGVYYKVVYIKGTSSSFTNSQLTNATLTKNIDVNTGQCTVVSPFSGQVSIAASCPTTGTIGDIVHLHNITMGICINNKTNVCVASASGLSPKHIDGHVTIDESGPWDNDPNVSRRFCVGSATITLTQDVATSNTAAGTQVLTFSAPLRYHNASPGDNQGHCKVKVHKSGLRLNANVQHTLKAHFTGNTYLNPPAADATATFTPSSR